MTTKKQIIETMTTIDSELSAGKLNEFTKGELTPMLADMEARQAETQAEQDKEAREQIDHDTQVIAEAIEKIEASDAKEAENYDYLAKELMESLETAASSASRQKHIVLHFMTHDLKLHESNITGHGKTIGIGADPIKGSYVDSKGNTHEYQAYAVATGGNAGDSELLQFHAEILARKGTKMSNGEDFDYTNAKKNLNTRIRELCSQKEIPKVQIKGTGKQDYRLEVAPDTLPKSETEKQEEIAKQEQETIKDGLETMTKTMAFSEALELVVNQYLSEDNPRYKDMVQALDLASYEVGEHIKSEVEPEVTDKAA